MENIYDLTDEFAAKLAATPECQNFKAAQQRLRENPEKQRQVADYLREQVTVQARQAMGQTLSDEEIAAFNDKTRELMAQPEVAAYFGAQMAFMPIFQDIVKKISEAAGFDPSSIMGNLGQ